MAWATAFVLGAITLERLIELIIARRNTAKLLERGGIEHGAGHYPVMIALHACWLAGLWYFAWQGLISWIWLSIFLGVEVLRLWVLATLGSRWTTRIITVPGETLVARGPYKFVRHPNYAVVALEIFVLPMVWGLFWFAAAFSLANAVMLWWRIRAEEGALHVLR